MKWKRLCLAERLKAKPENEIHRKTKNVYSLTANRWLTVLGYRRRIHAERVERNTKRNRLECQCMCSNVCETCANERFVWIGAACAPKVKNIDFICVFVSRVAIGNDGSLSSLCAFLSPLHCNEVNGPRHRRQFIVFYFEWPRQINILHRTDVKLQEINSAINISHTYTHVVRFVEDVGSWLINR